MLIVIAIYTFMKSNLGKYMLINTSHQNYFLPHWVVLAIGFMMESLVLVQVASLSSFIRFLQVDFFTCFCIIQDWQFYDESGGTEFFILAGHIFFSAYFTINMPNIGGSLLGTFGFENIVVLSYFIFDFVSIFLSIDLLSKFAAV